MGPPAVGAPVADRQQLVHQPVPAHLRQQNRLEQLPFAPDQREKHAGVCVSQGLVRIGRRHVGIDLVAFRAGHCRPVYMFRPARSERRSQLGVCHLAKVGLQLPPAPVDGQRVRRHAACDWTAEDLDLFVGRHRLSIGQAAGSRRVRALADNADP